MKMTTQITLIRSGNYYLHSIHRNGAQVAPAVAIAADRAREIHQENIGEEQRGWGVVNFDQDGGNWERSYFVNGNAPTVTPTAYRLRHPEHDVTAMAEVMSHWYEAGRWVGFCLRFAGENAPRSLTFGEIRELQAEAAVEEVAA